jgi:hypothetical protein
LTSRRRKIERNRIKVWNRIYFSLTSLSWLGGFGGGWRLFNGGSTTTVSAAEVEAWLEEIFACVALLLRGSLGFLLAVGQS